MRIDFVFPRFKLLSGAERSILELSAALHGLGHRPRVVCHRFDDSCRPLLRPGVELIESGARLDWFGNRYLNAAVDYLQAPRLRRLLDAEADATVLCGPALSLVWWLRRRGAGTVLYHCFEPPRALHQDRDDVLRRTGLARWPLTVALRLYGRLDRALVRRVDAVTAVSPFAAARAREIYGRPAFALTHGLTRGPLDRARALGLEKRFSLITVNYLHPRKRVDLVIRALAELRRTMPEATLEVVGDGPERAALEALAAELGLASAVRFAGFVPEAELPEHYCAAACYVHATREESFGLSVIEAAYCGLPVVAVAEGGVLETVLEGESGFLVPASPEALATAVRRVLELPDGGRAMGERGRRHVAERYRWERGAEDLLAVIREAI